MISVYLQLLRILFQIHVARAQGYETMICLALYPRTQELLRKIGFTVNEYSGKVEINVNRD